MTSNDLWSRLSDPAFQAWVEQKHREHLAAKARERGQSNPPSTVNQALTRRVGERPMRAALAVMKGVKLPIAGRPPRLGEALKREPRRWYCGPCDRLWTRSGDCPACGAGLDKWPGGEL